jgi:hypothetical protein
MSTAWLLQDEFKVFQYGEGANETSPETILLNGDAINSKAIRWEETNNYFTDWVAAHYYLEYGDDFELGVGWVAPWNAYGNGYGQPILDRGLENSGIQYSSRPNSSMVVVPAGEQCKVACSSVPHRRTFAQCELYWSYWVDPNIEGTVTFESIDYDEEQQWSSNHYGFRLHSGKPYAKASAYVIWDDETSGSFRRVAIQLFDTMNNYAVLEWENIVPADTFGAFEATQYVETDVIPSWQGDFMYERLSQYVLRVVIEHDADYLHGVWEGRLTVEYYG